MLCTNTWYVLDMSFVLLLVATDLGFTRDTKQSFEKELQFARSTVAIAAKAAHVLSFDTPNVQFTNGQHLLEECTQVKQLGIKGKFAIHPNQITTINTVFGFSAEEVAYATRVVNAFESSVKQDARASISVDGRMVDVPVYKRYKSLLEAHATMQHQHTKM